MDSLGTTTRGLILAAAGVTLLGVVLPLQLRTRTLLKHGVKVRGTVVDAEEKTGRGSDNLRYRTYHPVVRFTTADGRTVTFTSGLGFSVRQARIGSAVPVRYRQDDLEKAEIDRAYIWMVPAAPSLLAGGGVAGGRGGCLHRGPAGAARRGSTTWRIQGWRQQPLNGRRMSCRRPRSRAAGLATS